MTKSRKYGHCKWSKMTNKTGVKTAGSLENAINPLKNPIFSTPVYSMPQACAGSGFAKIHLAYRLAWCDNKDG